MARSLGGATGGPTPQAPKKPDLHVLPGGNGGSGERAPGTAPLTEEQQRLVDAALPMLEPCARFVAQRFRYLGVEAGELMGPGAIALREAAIAYVSGRHASFATYARYNVLGRMTQAVRVDHFSLRGRVERAMDRAMCLFEAHQASPVAGDGGPDEGPIEATRRGAAEALAASAIAGVLAAEEESPESASALRISLREGVGTLLPAEREVIRLFFEEDMTLDEIAAKTGVHANTAQRRHARALEKLRAFFAAGSGDG